MPKRKREFDAEDIASRRKATKVENQLSHGKRALQRALKVAKRFEGQKLTKRRRKAVESQRDADVARIDAEVEALKMLDLASTAEIHLYKTLMKDKRIEVSQTLPENVRNSARVPLDTGTENVTARLYNTNPVKEAMSDILSTIRASLGILDSEKGAARSKKSTEGATGATNGSLDPHANGRAKDEIGQSPPVRAQPAAAADSIESDADEDDFAHLNNRIASSSRGSESPPPAAAPQAAASHAYNPAADLSLSPSPTPSNSPTPPPQKGVPSSRTTTSASRGTSSFLPSLTMGGYISGSDSEPEDDGLGTSGGIAPRRNRRGQRARQAIWEKKFGARAKHLSKPGGGRDTGWDPKSGATEGGRRGERRKNGLRPVGSGVASGGNAEAVSEKRAVQKEVLHPSWQAAKKAKEAKQNVAFAGKRVVFE